MIGLVIKFVFLELGCEVGCGVGNCDLGYSCAYLSNVFWVVLMILVGKEVNLWLVFECLFLYGLVSEVVVN